MPERVGVDVSEGVSLSLSWSLSLVASSSQQSGGREGLDLDLEGGEERVFRGAGERFSLFIEELRPGQLERLVSVFFLGQEEGKILGSYPCLYERMWLSLF